MIVVKKCNQCGRIYDAEFMANGQCQCVTAKSIVIKNNEKKPRGSKWNNVPANDLPTLPNKREKESEAILAMFSTK